MRMHIRNLCASAELGVIFTALTLVLARELERIGVRVNAIAPVARTRLTEAVAGDNRRALAFARAHKIPGAVGSDAHRPWEIGRAYLEVPDFTGRDDFIASLKNGKVTGRLAGHSIHFYTRYDKFRKWLHDRRRSKTS